MQLQEINIRFEQGGKLHHFTGASGTDRLGHSTPRNRAKLFLILRISMENSMNYPRRCWSLLRPRVQGIGLRPSKVHCSSFYRNFWTIFTTITRIKFILYPRKISLTSNFLIFLWEFLHFQMEVIIRFRLLIYSTLQFTLNTKISPKIIRLNLLERSIINFRYTKAKHVRL